MSAILLLCNLTDNMAQPWLEAGCEVHSVDPQHLMPHRVGNHHCYGCTVLEFAQSSTAVSLIRSGRLALVAGFPPCTDVAVSGARWWKEKRVIEAIKEDEE